jgi:type IV pilus assembly protein PilB
MSLSDNKLKDLIEKNKLVQPIDLANAQKIAIHLGCSITDVLLGRDILKEDELGNLLSDFYKAPYVDLRKIDIAPSTLHQIPEEFAAEKGVIAFDSKDGVLSVAFEDPDDLAILESVKKILTGKYNIKIYVSTPQAVKASLKFYKNEVTDGSTEHIQINEVPSSVDLVNEIVDSAIRQEASDIHVEALPDKMLIRFRVDGVLHDEGYWVKEAHTALIARVKILADLKIDETRLPQDGQFSYSSKRGDKVSLRVSTTPTAHGEKIVMRILQSGLNSFNLDDLGMLPEDQEVVSRILEKTHGMFLVTGPTGSGKTTTLYTILGLLNKPDVNILTIEDPVENKITRVNQIQVNSAINLTFANGLRSILRQDPDIVMVGEIRDKETAQIGINAAMTGHLVFSSVHANTSAGAIPRMIDLGIEPFLLASTLNMVIAQRLVRVLCPNCKQKAPLTHAILQKLEEIGGEISKETKKMLTTNYAPKGCGHCFNTGYKGRIGIFETLRVSEKISKLIFQKETSDAIWEAAREDKTKSMVEDGIIKVTKGLTTIEEVLRVISI